MIKFKPGEIAIFVGPVKHPLALGIIETGDEVTLLEYDPSDDLWMMDRKAQEGASLWAKTKYLRKRRPPEQPADDQEFIDWCNKLGRRPAVDVEKVKEALLSIPFPRVGGSR